MPRFAANLSMLYPEHDFLARFEAAARDGFTGVEYLFPYEHEPRELAARLRAHGLQQVLFNGPPGHWNGGERGLACLPGREAEFREGIAQALRYAQALDCPRVHVMAGLVPAGQDRAALRPTYVAPDLRGLLEAQPAPTLASDGVQLGGWHAQVHDGRLDVTGRGGVGDWWRVVAAAAWAHLDGGGDAPDVSELSVPRDSLQA